MMYMIRQVLSIWSMYWGKGYYPYLLAVAVLSLLVWRKRKDAVYLLIYIGLFLVVFFCPVTAAIIWKMIGDLVYWRVLWVLPAVPVMAYAGTLFIKRIRGGLPRTICLVCMLCLIVLCGTGMRKAGYFIKGNNHQKVPDAVAQICTMIRGWEGEDEVLLAASDEVASFVRVFDPSIRMLYGRRGTGAISKRAKIIYNQSLEEDPDYALMAKYAARMDCQYMVFPITGDEQEEAFKKSGYELVGSVNQYGIFKKIST